MKSLLFVLWVSALSHTALAVSNVRIYCRGEDKAAGTFTTIDLKVDASGTKGLGAVSIPDNGANLACVMRNPTSSMPELECVGLLYRPRFPHEGHVRALIQLGSKENGSSHVGKGFVEGTEIQKTVGQANVFGCTVTPITRQKCDFCP